MFTHELVRDDYPFLRLYLNTDLIPILMRNSLPFRPLTPSFVHFANFPLTVTNKYIHIPSPLSLFQQSRLSHLVPIRGQGAWERILRNPYALPPILFCLAILGGEMVLNV